MRVAIRDHKGNIIPENLGSEIAHGGEGAVYHLANPELSNLCVKIYHDHKLESLHARNHEAKLSVMIANELCMESDQLAWPRRVVFDESGEKWLGYAMPKATGFALDQLCHLQRVKERFDQWRRSHFARITLSILEAFSFIHSNNDLVGDINPRNILVNPETLNVTLLDCDSMHIVDGNRLFPCTVALPAYIAPELQRSSNPNSDRTIYSERFSLAILIASLWMLGKHPFSCVIPDHADGGDYRPAANIVNGRCPLMVGSTEGIPPGPWGYLWMQLPMRIQTLFVSAFKDGLNVPDRRPTLDEWHSAFSRYLADLEDGSEEDTRLLEGLPTTTMRPPPLPPKQAATTNSDITDDDKDHRAYEFNGRLVTPVDSLAPPPLIPASNASSPPAIANPAAFTARQAQNKVKERAGEGFGCLAILAVIGMAALAKLSAAPVIAWLAFFAILITYSMAHDRAVVFPTLLHEPPTKVRWELIVGVLFTAAAICTFANPVFGVLFGFGGIGLASLKRFQRYVK